jgi:hypothetical protein
MAGAIWPAAQTDESGKSKFRLECHLWGSKGSQLLASINSQFHLKIPINRPDLGTAISAYSLASSKEQVEVTSVGIE